MFQGALVSLSVPAVPDLWKLSRKGYRFIAEVSEPEFGACKGTYAGEI
jgi:hypothetical protein